MNKIPMLILSLCVLFYTLTVQASEELKVQKQSKEAYKVSGHGEGIFNSVIFIVPPHHKNFKPLSLNWAYFEYNEDCFLISRENSNIMKISCENEQ